VNDPRVIGTISGHSATSNTLQDFCRQRTPLLLRLVTQLGRCALQEDMAKCASGLVTIGQWILEHTVERQKGSSYDAQPELPFASPPGSGPTSNFA
jgi:hypothetical protein